VVAPGLGATLHGERTVRLVATLARALDYAHRKGVVHRDIKASNVLLTADGEAKITTSAWPPGHLDLTAEGPILGSPSYMSPEQMSGLPVDGRSDLYSLASSCSELLTGTKPFKAKSLPDFRRSWSSSRHPTRRSYGPGCRRRWRKWPALPGQGPGRALSDRQRAGRRPGQRRAAAGAERQRRVRPD